MRSAAFIDRRGYQPLSWTRLRSDHEPAPHRILPTTGAYLLPIMLFHAIPCSMPEPLAAVANVILPAGGPAGPPPPFPPGAQGGRYPHRMRLSLIGRRQGGRYGGPDSPGKGRHTDSRNGGGRDRG